MAVGVNPAHAASHGKLPVDSGKRVAKLYNAGGLITRRTVDVVGKDGNILFARRGKPSVDEILRAIPGETVA
jgi:hypothetical protein